MKIDLTNRVRICRWPNAAAAGLILCLLIANHVVASDLDTIGLTLLRSVTTNLNGSGVRVAQVEAEVDSSSSPTFEVNPVSPGLASSNFTWFTGPPTAYLPQSTSTFPNSLGAESWHADDVGYDFYGLAEGVSTNVAHVDNFEGEYFFVTVVPGGISINDSIVNQSFVASASTNVQQQTYDSEYDTYSAQYGVLFVSGAGNGGAVSPPSTCYNGIGVAAYQGYSSVGPTPDNGRAKPDITAPAAETSFSTPLVSGAATLLLQAGLRGDGGTDTNSAADMRTLKALLLNGAVKPSDWSNPSSSPLDPRYGAGVLNVYNSFRQLAAGKHGLIESGSVSTGSAHPPLSNTNNVSTLYGWDFNTNTSGALTDNINHYYFSLVPATPGASFTATISLVWNRQAHQSSINHLQLFLYNTTSGSLVASSTSSVDNVQHIFVPQLPPGRYDLQVLKQGGSTVSAAETYALAFEFFSMPLSLSQSGSSTVLTWPLYPAGFSLESTSAPGLGASWSRGYSPVLTNNQNKVILSSGTGNLYFRLVRP